MNATEHRKVPGRRRRLSVTDFHRMAEAGIFGESERVELIDGELVDMPPIGPAHADIVNVLVKALSRALSHTCAGERYLLTVQNPVQLHQYAEVYPDAAVVRQQRYNESHPTPEDVFLIIEVSDTTLTYDREVKIPSYAACGIPEAWIINIVDRCVEVYREPDCKARRYSRRQRIRTGTVCMRGQADLKLEPSELFAGS